MWNRVILLLSGVAFGWNLVHLASAPRKDLAALRLALAVSGAVGVGLAVLIGLRTPAAGILALAVMVGSAFVAYAANAKQVSRPPAPPLLHGLITPESQDDRTGILLVVGGEPARYEGPSFWAWWLKVSTKALKTHWFLTPWRFGRIRQVYASMGGDSPLANSVERLCGQLSTILGAGYVVRYARLFASPPVRDSLAELAQAGLKRIVIVPLAQPFAYQEALQEQITLSRVREAGVRLTMAPAIAAEEWLGMSPAQRLDNLLEGTAPPAPLENGDLAHEIAKVVQHAEKESLPRPHLMENPYG